jgi:hypothetical protein
MIPGLMKLTGFGAGAVKILLIAGALLTLGLSVKAWFYFHDQGVIENHENGIAAQVGEKTLDAERSAEASDRATEARNRARAGAIDERMTDAIVNFPEAAAGSAGPASQSVLDELRNEAVDQAGPDSNAADRTD